MGAAEANCSGNISTNEIPLNRGPARAVIESNSQNGRDQVACASRSAADEAVRGILDQANSLKHGKMGDAGCVRADVVALNNGSVSGTEKESVDVNSDAICGRNNVTVRGSCAANNIAGDHAYICYYFNRRSATGLTGTIGINTEEVSRDGVVIALHGDPVATVHVNYHQTFDRGTRAVGPIALLQAEDTRKTQARSIDSYQQDSIISDC